VGTVEAAAIWRGEKKKGIIVLFWRCLLTTLAHSIFNSCRCSRLVREGSAKRGKRLCRRKKNLGTAGRKKKGVGTPKLNNITKLLWLGVSLRLDVIHISFTIFTLSKRRTDLQRVKIYLMIYLGA
jgi:hypothetical protein